jgi:hypothetical protein
MKVDKMSISVDADLGDEIRAAAKQSKTGLSSWLAEAARARLRADALGKFLDVWEAKHGKLTRAELARAEEQLGIRPVSE